MARKLVVPWLALLVLGLPVVAQAAPPEHIYIDISEEIPFDDFLSQECGTEGVITVTGTVKVTLWRNAEGLIVREQGRAPGSKIIFSALTGNSFSFPGTTVTTVDYGDGAEVGSEAIVTERGLLGRATGFIPADAGSVTRMAEVTGFDEFGIPELNFPDVPPIRETGNRASEERIVAAICEALTG